MNTRRDFLVTAGQAGLAASVVVPGVRRGWLNAPDGGAAEAGGAPLSPEMQQLASLSSSLQWRLIGPFRGGRVDAVSGVPGRRNEFYFGAVNGGVWKSSDAGRVWRPVFDSQPVASIGALAVAPSAPDVVYVGTGESTLRDSAGYGNGVYKTSDGGRSWTHLGLADTQHIGKIAVDPRNPDVVFVAAIGNLYAPNPDRGVFRSRDGGRTWQKVLYKDENVGAAEVVIDPANPRVVYAGLWNTRRPPWYTYQPSNGPGGGLFKSIDGGTTWRQLGNGLPAEGIGRCGIAVAPSQPRRVYAVVDCLVPEAQAPPAQGGLFRSDDAGATWCKLSGDQALWGRGWYFEKIAVDPRDPDIVYVPNVAVSRSKDGGATWAVIRGSPGGDDYHQVWVSPDDPDTLIVASDQGAIVTRNARADDPRDMTWSSWFNQPTAQLYHASVDYRFPYWVTGAQQDSGGVAVRSRGKFAEISQRDWEPIGAAGESGCTAGDPLHPGVVYGGSGSRWDLESNSPVPGTTIPRGPEPSRSDWTQPLVLSPVDPHVLYYASQFLFKSTDGARTWATMSPDLTRPEPGVPPTLDAAAAADTGSNGRRGVIYSIAPSPLTGPMVWIGTDDGWIQLTTDDGATWQNVTPPALTAWSRVSCVEASHFDDGTAYATVDRHQLADFEPYVYRTRDRGRSWTRVTVGLPPGEYVHVVKEDPRRLGLLFAGTERGAFVSFDDGDHWQPLQLNLPATSVRDFVIYGNDLIVATHGRGIWVMDDISPLRQLDEAVLRADAFLFKPADTIYVPAGSDNGTPVQRDEPQASNPPDGAVIDYYLKAAPAAPVTLEILDTTGAVLRTFSSDPAAQPAAPGGRAGVGGGSSGGGIPRTSPLWRMTPEPFSAAAGMHRMVWRPVAMGGGFGSGGGGGRGAPPRLLTGTFTARLTAGGQAYTQTFTVSAAPGGSR